MHAVGDWCKQREGVHRLFWARSVAQEAWISTRINFAPNSCLWKFIPCPRSQASDINQQAQTGFLCVLCNLLHSWSPRILWLGTYPARINPVCCA